MRRLVPQGEVGGQRPSRKDRRNCDVKAQSPATLESWLEEEGIREEVTAAAVKAVLAAKLAAERKKKRLAAK